MIGICPLPAFVGRLATLVAALAAAACATEPRAVARFDLSAVITSAKTPSGRSEAYYAAAVQAIGRRDYPAALETLQAANAATPGDLRVLNAFGVVYDKLGRFDVSARYYAAALALDPTSRVVRANMAYSHELGRKAGMSFEDRAGRAPGDCHIRRADQDGRPACEV